MAWRSSPASSTPNDGESAAYAAWMRQHGMQPHVTKSINEGQGDLLVVGSTVLAGHGFRTDPQAHAEVAEITGMPVISLNSSTPASTIWTPR